jgi:hypothetical protein
MPRLSGTLVKVVPAKDGGFGRIVGRSLTTLRELSWSESN